MQYVLDHLSDRWLDEHGQVSGPLSTVDPKLATSCSSLWQYCSALVEEMEKEALEMPPHIKEIHSRLADIRGRLRDLAQREHTTADVKTIVQELDSIDDLRLQNRNSVFGGDVEAPVPGHSVCMELLVHNYELARACANTAQDVPKELRATADGLRGIKNDLRQLAGRKHHTAADLAHYKYLLTAIRAAEGEYETEWRGSEAEALMAECFVLVTELDATAEEMPPAVAEVHSKLLLHKEELEGMRVGSVPPTVDQLEKKKVGCLAGRFYEQNLINPSQLVLLMLACLSSIYT